MFSFAAEKTLSRSKDEPSESERFFESGTVMLRFCSRPLLHLPGSDATPDEFLTTFANRHFDECDAASNPFGSLLNSGEVT
jgi:hypothetical protein